MIDRIRVERVCKRWQKVTKASWSSLKELKINPKTLGLKPSGKHHQYPDIKVQEILKRCGRYLEKITSKQFLSCIDLIAEYCKNIYSIECREVSNKELKNLSDNCTNISELRIRCHSYYIPNIPLDEYKIKDKALSDLFSNNQQLRVLNIFGGSECSGECLLKLPLEQIQEMKLDFGENCHENLINAIYKLKKLRSFEYMCVNEKVIKALAISCNNLTVLKLASRSSINSIFSSNFINNLDDVLSQIFQNNKKIKSLSLSQFKTLTGKCFRDLDHNIVEEIELSDTDNLQREFLITSLPFFEKLHTLDFQFVERHSCDHVAECISLCHNLKKVTIYSCQFLQKHLRFSVCKLENLEMLSVISLHNCSITNNFFNDVSQNLLHLKHLDLTRCPGITDNKIKTIFNSSTLEVLKVNELINFTGSRLGDFPNLKEFHCMHCEKFEDDFLIRTIKGSSKLELIDAYNCKKITVAVVNIAIEETKKRKNNNLLEMCCYGTAIFRKLPLIQVNDVSPLFYLNMNNEFSEKFSKLLLKIEM